MTKSKIIQGLIAACLMVTFMSCSKFLDRKPYSQIESGDFYTNEKNIELATVGMYGVLQNFYSPDYPVIAELPADNGSTIDGPTGRAGMFDKFNLLPNNPVLESSWRLSYKGILQSNRILESLPEVEFSETAKKEQTEGEARFIRALNYFNLVRMFGKVPLDTVSLTQEQARQSIRDEVSDVYDLIISDLQIASDLLPSNYSGADIGRATKWAALALLSKVYFQNNQFAEALVPLKDIIDSEVYSLLPDFAAIFNPNNANNAESIFEIQYEGGPLGEGSRWSFTAHRRTLADAMGISSGAQLMPTSDIIQAFSDNAETSSPRYLASIGFMVGTNGSESYIKKNYMDHSYQNQSDDNWMLLRYADILLMYAEALNETSGAPPVEAIELVNQVRRRAFGLPIASVSIRDLTSEQTADKEAFRNAISFERRLELAFEGHRWYDLIRTGEYVIVMNAHFGANSPYKVEVHHKLCPVPLRETDINPLLLPNNDGY